MSIAGISLTQNMRQTQTLAPQMRQSLRMLQMTSLELRAELQHQMETNPAIEDVTGKMERPMSSELPEEHVSGAVSEKELDFTPTGEQARQTLSCDDADRDYYLQNMENCHTTTENGAVDPDAQSRRQAMFDRQVKKETLQEHLQKQIPYSDISDADRPLAELLVEYIDDNGYFKESLPDIEMVLQAKEERILAILRKIQQFDPVGCGGRNPREVLLAQMEKLDDSPWEDEVRLLIDKHLEDAAAHREALICRSLNVTPKEYQKVLAELRKLEPMPGRGFTPQEEASIYIRPEVFVSRTKGGEWRARVLDRDIPEIHISRKYIQMLEDPACPAETRSYIREHIRAAETLREAIEDRQDTIQNIAQAIVDAQTDVFEQNTMAALRPLTMDQIAQKVDVHNTTVSRTVRDKYMSTPFGVVEMRKFFTAGLSMEGGESISNEAVRNRIRTIVDAEDKAKPLSDDRISKMLQDDGISVARRTVTKYREQLGIPGIAARRIKA